MNQFFLVLQRLGGGGRDWGSLLPPPYIYGGSGWEVPKLIRRMTRSYLIFVTGTTGGARGEKICHVEIFVHMTDGQVE